MSSRFVPRSDSDLVTWLGTYRTQLPTYGKQVGLDATGIKDQQALCDEITAAVANDEKLYTDWRAAVARSAEVKARCLKQVQARIDQIRVHPACTDEIKAALGIVNPVEPTATLSDLKVPLSLEALPGRVVVKWRKGSLDGVNVYGQRGSESTWLLLARDNRPPYEDLRPLSQPGMPELRRYRVIGVVDDREVTPPSDVVQISIGD